MTQHRKIVSAALGAGLGLSALAVVGATPAQAVTGVFISEIHYDNAGSDSGEFVEVTAPAGTNLSGYSVVLYNGNGGAAYDTDPLSGVVADQRDGWGTAVVGYLVDGVQNGSPDGVALVNGGNVVEFVSYEGTMAATSGPAAGQTSTDIAVSEPSTTPVGQSLQRQVDGTWTGPAASSRGVPNGHTVGGQPLEATAGDVTGYVGVEIDEVVLAVSGGKAPYSWEVTGLPAGLSETEDGTIGGTPTAEGSSTVTAVVTDAAGATDSVTFTITVTEPQRRTIAAIQGTGPSSPLDGEVVRTEGVVTAAFPTGGYDGFYIQTAGADTTPGASDGLFVYEPGFADSITVGDSVEVTGRVDEYFGLTQLQALTLAEVADLGDVVPNDTVPGTECELPGSACPSASQLAAAREEVESEAFLPTDPYTVTDVYDGSAYNGASFSSRMFGEIGLAGGSELPLVTPTEVIDADETEALADRRAYNDAHRVILDDGSTADFTTAANQDSPFPYFTADHAVRVGAAVTFDEPVVLDYRFSVWRLQPQERVVGEPEGITFEQTREEDAEPADVGGDVKLATFNVLNYFPTTGEEWEAADPTNNECTYYEDRDDNPITNDQCGTDANPGPRGAADTVNFERQEAKIVDAIVELDADVVSLEEIENSVKFGKDRDFAVQTLVAALNEVEGAGTWDFAPSPDAADLPPVADQDVIRTAFIYKPATVALVGEPRVLVGGPAFEDAREPFGQAFKAVHEEDTRAFLVVANHFKSKRSGTPDPVQGNGTAERVQQAEALIAFADDFSTDLGITRVFLTGDFNAYSEEDPVQRLEEAGYTSLESTDDPHEETYNFDGMVGSLDHIFANEAAAEDVTGVDIWEINANESVYYEYSRYNYNVTNLYGVHPFRSSDHNPELVGIDVREPSEITVEVDPDGKIKPDKKVKVFATVTSPDGLPVSGTVTFTSEGVAQEVEIIDGRATGRFSWAQVGDHTVTIRYNGNDQLAPSETHVTVTVVEK